LALAVLVILVAEQPMATIRFLEQSLHLVVVLVETMLVVEITVALVAEVP
jgi:hypothetical protein